MSEQDQSTEQEKPPEKTLTERLLERMDFDNRTLALPGVSFKINVIPTQIMWKVTQTTSRVLAKTIGESNMSRIMSTGNQIEFMGAVLSIIGSEESDLIYNAVRNHITVQGEGFHGAMLSKAEEKVFEDIKAPRKGFLIVFVASFLGKASVASVLGEDL